MRGDISLLALIRSKEKKKHVINLCTAPCKPPCENRVVANGLCNGHRTRAEKNLPIDVPLRKYRAHGAAKKDTITVTVDSETRERLQTLAEEKGFKSVYALVLSTVEELAETARNSKT